MTSPHGATDRPFAIFVCTACAAERDLSIVDELRPTIRRCPRAVLVSAACMLGPLSCAARPAACGVMALLQPCTDQQVACGRPWWIGPINNGVDAAALRDWVELGQWEDVPLPEQLCKHQLWTHKASQSN